MTAAALIFNPVIGCGDSDDPASQDTLLPNDSRGGADTTTTARCGDGVVTGPDESCDEADQNGAYGSACNLTCDGPGPRCGDGAHDEAYGEDCDDGDALNGTYGRCGVGCLGLAQHCGNNFVEPAHEACDDGEHNGDYGFCLADCSAMGPRCGDGVVDSPEERCDDGEDNGKPDHCTRRCDAAPGCGDGVIAGDEVCDDGDDNGEYGKCAGDCAGPAGFCGDGVRQAKHEVCDHGEDNGDYGHCADGCGAFGPRCGDDHGDSDDEACDDGDDNGLPGRCRRDCSGLTLGWVYDGDPDPSGLTCERRDLLSKYFRYRRRLRGDGTAAFPGFVSIGYADGQSIPASRRMPDDSCQHYWSVDGCGLPEHEDAAGIVNWGDATIWLGMYVEQLVLEHTLFTRLGMATAEVERDLHAALAAIDRVDENAERYFGVPPARDGFFLRDDIPLGFELTSSGGYRFPRAADGLNGYGCASGNITCDPPTTENGSFTSQDQTVGLLGGLATVLRLLPETVAVDGAALADIAAEQAHRLVFKLRTDGWRIVDPTGESPPDKWGGNATGFSNQMAKIANAVVGDRFGVDDYRTLYSRTVGATAWSGLSVIWGATADFNRTMALRLASITNDWRPDRIGRLATDDHKPYFAIAHAILNDLQVSEDVPLWRIESALYAAPCGGPCRDAAGCEDVPGWRGESRIEKGSARGGSHHYRGEMNGMDYLALFAALHQYHGGHFTLSPPMRPASGCDAYVGLDQLSDGSAPQSFSWDPSDPCIGDDARRMFCGRPFASWVDDSYRGRVHLVTNGWRWACDGAAGLPCVVTQTGAGETSGDDLLIGSIGDDSLSGGGGNDCLVGLAGDDTIEGNQGYDWLEGGPGHDALYGESSNWIIVDGEGDILWGGPGNDLIEGGPGEDELYGEDGDDDLDGGSGQDIVEAGAGDDSVRGDGGDDVIYGGPGDDAIIGDAGDDTIWGGPGRDRIDGEGGADVIYGGPGSDFLRGGNGDDVLAAGSDGQDRLCGNAGDDTLWGGWDGDQCRGGGFWGGTDRVQGCDDDTASQSECDNGAYEDW